MTRTQARTSRLDRTLAMRLAATEYDRCADLLGSLDPPDWKEQTDCPSWDVRQLACHMLGMVEMAASVRELVRQQWKASRAGGEPIDALTGLQVSERADWSPDRVVGRFRARAPKAVAGRRRTPGFVRGRTMPPEKVGGVEEIWTVGFLIDVILTRDPWMHRIDLAHATGRPLHLTPDHDGALVADVVAEWASRHGRPVTLTLTGAAGGEWSSGSGGPSIELDAVEFCRATSGRDTGVDHPLVLGTPVPF